jgi:hypothetical protein
MGDSGLDFARKRTTFYPPKPRPNEVLVLDPGKRLARRYGKPVAFSFADSLDQLRIKTKTGDICDDCKGILSDNKVPFPIIEQLRNVFSLVRKIQINIEDFQQDWRQPRLEIKARQSLGS